MKKFEFSLQTVHNVREIRQEREEAALAQLNAEADDAQTKVVSAEKNRIKAYDDYTERLQSGTLDPVEMVLTTNYLSALTNYEQQARQSLELKKQACQRQTENVVVAAQQVKATATLRDSEQAKYTLNAARAEQNALDELNSINFARKMKQL